MRFLLLIVCLVNLICMGGCGKRLYSGSAKPRKYISTRLAAEEHRYGDAATCQSEATQYYRATTHRTDNPVQIEPSPNAVYSWRSPGTDVEIRFVVVPNSSPQYKEFIPYRLINKVIGNDRDDLEAAILPDELGSGYEVYQHATQDVNPVNGTRVWRAIMRKKRLEMPKDSSAGFLNDEPLGLISNPPYPP